MRAAVMSACSTRSNFCRMISRKVYMSRMGVSLPLDLDAKQAKATAGAQAGKRRLIADAGSCSRVGLTQDSFMHFTAWGQHAAAGAVDRFRSVAQEGNRSRGWLDISDQRGGVTVMLRNMWQEAPSELVVNTGTAGKGGPSFDVDLWPASALPMDMRRYSNYGHISQGESAGEENHDDSDWIDQVYYAPGRGPVEGVSKTHEFLIYFHDTSVATPAIDSLAADFQSPALIYAGPSGMPTQRSRSRPSRRAIRALSKATRTWTTVSSFSSSTRSIGTGTVFGITATRATCSSAAMVSTSRPRSWKSFSKCRKNSATISWARIWRRCPWSTIGLSMTGPSTMAAGVGAILKA